MIPYYSNDRVLLYNCDALAGMRQFPDECVQMCVTSPPYYNQRDYEIDGQFGLEETPQQYVDRLVEFFREVRRLLTPDGTLWLNLGDTYAANRTYQVHNTLGNKAHTFSRGSKVPDGLKPKDLIGIPWRGAFALQADGWWLRTDIIWTKANAMPESVRDRPGRDHEYIFLLTKSKSYYYDADSVKVAAAWERWGKQTTKKHNPLSRGSTMVKDATKEEIDQRPKERNLRTTWDIPLKGIKDAHFATFPEALAEIPILAGSREGDIVLDPFMGAGTTSVVSSRLGRDSIGFELNPEYCDIAVRRLSGTN